MGKRSDFKRIDKDFYRTIDERAVKALLPFLSDKERFIEPCAGAGDLVQQLVLNGHECVWASDIEPHWPIKVEKDALTLTKGNVAFATSIITNPPWSRPILHQMIEHFVTLVDNVWLLFDADWMHTQQASNYIRDYCTDIVSVGRLLWIPDTKMQGKDNVCWYRFSRIKGPELPTLFFGRAQDTKSNRGTR